MNSIDPHHLASIAALVVCLIGIGLLAHWLDKRAKQRRKEAKAFERAFMADLRDHPAPIPGESRREHIERLARLRNWPKPPPPATRSTRNPGPGLRPHPVYGDQPESRGAWVIPPADLLAPITTRGEGDCFNPTIPGADWKPAGGEFGGGGASGTWDTPSTDTATTASTAE